MKRIDDIPLLRRMAKAGIITLHHQTGTKITGLYSDEKFTWTYIADGPHTFDFEHRRYGVRYVSVCFCPYVFLLD